MIADSLEVRPVPIAAITVLNPRSRNKRIFQELVTSISHLGLKSVAGFQCDGSRRCIMRVAADLSGLRACAICAASR